MSSGIESKMINLGQFFDDKTQCFVPDFQRDYGWAEEQIDELWTDIVNTIDEDRIEHFLGAIVVNSENQRRMLIDGQQRIATISILMCVFRDLFIDYGDNERSRIVENNYISTSDLETTDKMAKLELNELNNPFYKDTFI
ncbi:MAG: DUF262 domain-containing protein [Chloroflexi bacterium AL-W]|nr:DUF262 domain-containing protein [Chloroflexi bacterium AL-N1]NOK71047.1 DUF262 domain-containing protein [Chloroflexi bacterium AL-N10]NOK72730.1 DUF262 domain-containing protein [Chloroflexi bacterium AL-N5]NOK79182.1 DUF262 domain-containing protein [Chloroflexi bacterium AL-W]NOK87097.1 DUF262 domain-containing protein [Chloroflexi bacterium AL-N15]